MVKGKVSIIVPCFNYGRFLGETLESLLKQTYSNWECIIVDDGSVDNTKEVAANYGEQDHRIQYVYQVNSGVAAARNKGLKLTMGEFICFLDADDLLAPAKLDLHVNKLNQDASIGIVYSNVRYFHTGSPGVFYKDAFLSNRKWMAEISGRRREVLPTIIDRNIMTVNAAVVRRLIVDLTGDIDESLNAIEDWEYWVRCCLKDVYFHFEPSEEALAYVRIHEKSHSRDITKVKKAELVFREDFANKIRTNPWGLQDEVRSRVKKINQYRIAELNVRYLTFIRGWLQSLCLALTGFRISFILINGTKSTIKRIILRD